MLEPWCVVSVEWLLAPAEPAALAAAAGRADRTIGADDAELETAPWSVLGAQVHEQICHPQE
jgi:hypothetical protein